MFQRLTRVLFGDAAGDSSLLETKYELDEKEEDDEWILVDYHDADGTSYGIRASRKHSQEIPSPDDQSLYSSCSSLYMLEDPEDGSCLCALNEGWIVTPPPCFTAGGEATVLLETNPLENLLIEHPSMSVYTLHSRHHSPRNGVYTHFHQPNCRSEPQQKQNHFAGSNTAKFPKNLFEQSKRRLRQRVKDNLKRQRLSHNALRRHKSAP
ncbi:tumor protein p53-inducible nuclear protein 1-like [Scleropages formosus]|uniref:Tumor protein p53 inducible nuclear protein 1 n=1 Tax=Scleropages formosus TaxID=113540 RepID=A0A8C9RGQ0_SCLFO|nr:tumor protein p53-inducible nuclear protein 1-like [Scleropages formosus]